MKDYLRAFFAFDSRALGRTVAFNLAAALTESAGLMLLLPLLSLAGVLEQGSRPAIFAPLKGIGLGTALSVFVLLVFLQSCLSYFRERENHSLQTRFGDHLRRELFAAIAGCKWSFYTGFHSGEFASVLTGEIQRIVSGTYFLLRFFTVAVLAFAYVLVALALSVKLTLFALATGALLWTLLRTTDIVAKQGGALVGEANRAVFVEIQEFLSAMKLIKIHGEEEGSVRRFERRINELSARGGEFQRAGARVQAAYRAGGATALALFCYAALDWFHLSPARLLVMIAIFARMLPQFAELQRGRQQLLHMFPAFSAWKKLFDSCVAHRDFLASTGSRVPLAREIHFEGVEFSRAHHRLQADNLSLPANKTTAIVGESGSGKTTLLDLLSGLVSPDAGSIKVDGAPLSTLSGWRKSIAYIPQETVIQQGSIRDNLCWGNSATEAEIWQTLAQAALAEFVQKLPHGLDTEVGERGIRLSGGEKQRLALARAFLRRPALLVLDEATGALDPGNHRLVLDSVRELHGSMTVLIVTHRIEELSGLIDGLVHVEEGKVGQWQPA